MKGPAHEMALSYRRLAARFGEEDERRRPGCRFLALAAIYGCDAHRGGKDRRCVGLQIIRDCFCGSTRRAGRSPGRQDAARASKLKDSARRSPGDRERPACAPRGALAADIRRNGSSSNSASRSPSRRSAESCAPSATAKLGPAAPLPFTKRTLPKQQRRSSRPRCSLERPACAPKSISVTS